MGLLTAIASAAAPAIIGGLFGGGGSESSSSTTSSTINYKNLMKARKYGLNPLTMIGAGQVPMSTTTHGKLAGPDPFMQALGEGFSNAAETWFNRDQLEMEHEVNKLKRDILKEELNVLQERNSQELVSQSFGYSIPKAVETGPAAGDTPSPVRRSTGVLAGKDAPHGLEDVEVDPVVSTPLLARTRTGMKDGSSWTTLNPDAWEIGVEELAGGAIVHTGAWLANKMKGLYEAGQISKAEYEAYKKKKAKAKRPPSGVNKPPRGYYGTMERTGF